MIMPISQMIMAEVAGPKRMGRVMGIVVMPAMLAPILGPVVGGLILQNLHWSWIFFVNVPIGIVAGILGWRMLPESNLGKAGKLDWLGLALLATSMPLIVYGLSEIATKESFTAPTVIWPIVAGIALAGSFGWHALHVERPLLDVRLYANRIFAAASLTTFGLGAALFGAMILVPLYYQQVRGEDVIVTGLLVGPQGLGMLLVGPLDRPLHRPLRRRPRRLRRHLGPHPQLAAARLHRRRHLDPLDLGPAAGPRRRHRPLLHPDDDRRLRLAADRPALRRDAADERAAAGRRRDRHRRPRRRPAAGEQGRLQSLRAGRRLRHRLLVGARHLRRLDDPVLVLLRAEGPKEEGPVSAEVEMAEEFVEPIGA